MKSEKGTAAVEIRDVSFSYGEAAILSSIDLRVRVGEYIGLIGPNGGGKTTLLRILMGFLHPDEGSVSIFGKPVREARRLIGYVPQNLRYDRTVPITVLELVLSGLVGQTRWWGPYRSQDKRRALEALELVGLADRANDAFGALSGGQAQRALIARALVSQPQLLLLDEPTANVDAEAEAEIFALIHSLRGKQTIMMVTHDLEEVIDKVDRVLIVQKELKSIAPEKVCEHFTIGLYHRPLIEKESDEVS